MVTDTREITAEAVSGALSPVSGDVVGWLDKRSDNPVPAFGLALSVLPLPEHARRAFENGRAAALAGRVDHDARRGDAAEIADDLAGRQALARKDALLSALPEHRLDCLAGLACLAPDQHARRLQQWLNDPMQRTLILAGGTGTGKTQAAYATAAQAARYGVKVVNQRGEVVDRQLVVRAWPVNRYLDELMPEGSPEPVWAIRHRAERAELLILDDLGAELDDVATRFMRKEIADLLDARFERRARTIFTTNHGARVIEQRLGDRLWSRLQQQSTALKFLGPDRRAMTQLDW